MAELCVHSMCAVKTRSNAEHQGDRLAVRFWARQMLFAGAAKPPQGLHASHRAQVRAYSRVFWERYTELNDYERITKNIERGEQRIQRQADIMAAIAAKLDRYRNPWQARHDFCPLLLSNTFRCGTPCCTIAAGISLGTPAQGFEACNHDTSAGLMPTLRRRRPPCRS